MGELMNGDMVPVEFLRHGDVVREGMHRGFVVKSVEEGCDRNHVHVNNSLCYDRGLPMEVVR